MQLAMGAIVENPSENVRALLRRVQERAFSASSPAPLAD